MFRRLMLSLPALMLLAGCASTRPDMAALRPTEDTSTAVVKITYPTGGDDFVSRQEFEQARDKLLNGAPEQIVLDYLATRHLLLREAQSKGVTADPAEVDQFVEQIRSQTCAQAPIPEAQTETDPARLLDACAQFFGFESGAAMRRYLQEEILVNQLVEQEAEPAPAEPGTEVHVAHILTETEEEAQAARERVTTGGEDFAAVAAEVSTDPSAQQNSGDLGFIRPGQTVPQFEQAATALKDGEISQPVQTQFGWHVIKTIERRPIGELSPEEQQASQQAAAEAYRQSVLEQAKAENRVTYLYTPPPEPTAAPPPVELPTVEIEPEATAAPAQEGLDTTATPAE